MLCAKCNTMNRSDSRFCKKCGQRLEAPGSPTQKMPDSGSAQTVQLPESQMPSMYAPPPPSYPPPAAPPPPPGYSPPGYVPPNYTPPGYTPPGYAPPGYSPASEPAPQSRWQQMTGTRGFRLALVGGALLALLLISGLLIAQFAPSLLPKGKEILIANPQRSGEYDLYMVKSGQALDRGVLLVEDAQLNSGNVSLQYVTTRPSYQILTLSANGSGFLPDTNRLVYWYAKRGRVHVEEIRARDSAPVEIMRTDALPLTVWLFRNEKEMFLQETRSGLERCYVASPRQPAERLTRGDGCGPTWHGAYAWSQERNQDQTSLSLLQMNGRGNPITVYNRQREIGWFEVSKDAKHVAYTQNSRRGWQLYLFTAKGETTQEIGRPGGWIHQYGFLGTSGTLFYTQEDEDGVLQLFLSTSETPLAEAAGLAVAASDDGRYLIYMTIDRDGERAVSSYDVRAGRSQTILSQDRLQFTLLDAHNTILLYDQDSDELTVRRANLDGSNLELLFSDDNIASFQMYSLQNDDRLYIALSDGRRYESLFTTSLSKADGFYLAEDWYDITLLNQAGNGRSLVLSMQEDPGDDYVLYSVALQKGSSLVKLDDRYEFYGNAIFSANNRDVLYTGVNSGRFDDVDVLQAPVNGKQSGEVLYKEAQLVDARWGSLEPFQFVSPVYPYGNVR